jgi:hypothetical protein
MNYKRKYLSAEDTKMHKKSVIAFVNTNDDSSK